MLRLQPLEERLVLSGSPLDPTLATVALTVPGPQTVVEGQAVDVAVSETGVSDPAHSAVALPPGLTINPITGKITGTVTAGAGGASGETYESTVSVADAAGNSATGVVIDWTVNPGQQTPGSTNYGSTNYGSTDYGSSTSSGSTNYGSVGGGSTPVAIQSPGNQTVVEGQSVWLAVPSSGGTNPTFSATALPPGLWVDPTTGVISGVVTPGAAASGPFVSTVSASDGPNGSVVASITWTVTASAPTPAATLTVPSPMTAAGSSVAAGVQATGVADPVFEATGLPPGFYLSPTFGTGATFFGTISASVSGTYESTITLVNAPNGPISQTLTWTVTPAPVVPTLTVPSTESVAEGQAVDVAATTTGLTNPTFAASNLSPGLSIDPTTGAIAGTVAAGASSQSSYYSTVEAFDAAGHYLSATIFWTVPTPSLSGPGDQTVAEGQAVRAVATATGVTNPLFAATNLPPGLSINAETGEITGTVEAGAAEHGPYATTITVTNTAAGVSPSAFVFWDVSPDPTKPTLTGPGDQTVVPNQSVSLAVATTNIANPTFSATGLPPGLGIDSETGEITGTIDPSADQRVPYVSTISIAGGPTGILTALVSWTATSPTGSTASNKVGPPSPQDVADEGLAYIMRSPLAAKMFDMAKKLSGGLRVCPITMFMRPNDIYIRRRCRRARAYSA